MQRAEGPAFLLANFGRKRAQASRPSKPSRRRKKFATGPGEKRAQINLRPRAPSGSIGLHAGMVKSFNQRVGFLGLGLRQRGLRQLSGVTHF